MVISHKFCNVSILESSNLVKAVSFLCLALPFYISPIDLFSMQYTNQPLLIIQSLLKCGFLGFAVSMLSIAVKSSVGEIMGSDQFKVNNK